MDKFTLGIIAFPILVHMIINLLSRTKNKSDLYLTFRRIFLDRSQSNYNHCQIKNFIEIKKLSAKKNLKIYKPELLSFKKQENKL